jgi:lipopolysaccharide transport system ATP-binding protein
MMSYAIKIENLSKKYVISHGQTSGSLKELAEHFRRKVTSPFYSKTNNQNIDPLEITYEEFWALKDINCEVSKGAKLGVMGRNGAGKSTLLKILSRITEPTSGKISIDGRISSLLEVGTGFHHELSGRENVYLNGAILGMKRSEITRKFDEIVRFSEIEQFIDTPVKRYSSGMQVRLAFSVAAHLEPEILILDEVLAVGDVGFQKKCLKKMNEISSSGATVIFVNHGVDAIKQYCNQAIVLERGSLILNTTDIDCAIKTYIG